MARWWELDIEVEHDREIGPLLNITFEFGPRVRRPEMVGTEFDHSAWRWIWQFSCHLRPLSLSAYDRTRHGWHP